MKKIYLDYAATTPVDKDVLKTVLPYFSKKFGNAMSIHSFGQEALRAVDKARQQVANFLNCSSSEIIFTSGATESNNLAIKGVALSYRAKFNSKADGRPHIITTPFEHHCVLDACKALEKGEQIELSYLPVYKEGIVKIDDIRKLIKKNTILVSVMYVNNEIGTLQPIAEIGKLIKKVNSGRKENKFPLLFHTDGTQGINYFDSNVEKLSVDLLSFSGHKIYSPKGIGVLYIRKNSPIRRIQDGGDQEFKMRAGTHNVSGIVGIGKAIEILGKNKEKDAKKIRSLRDRLIKKVLEEIPNSHLNGSLEKRSPNNANFRFEGVEGEGLVLSLDMEGVAASTGSACSSGALEPSHALLAIGLKPEQAYGSLRLSLSKFTTKKEIDEAIKILKKIIKHLRQISGSVLKEFES